MTVLVTGATGNVGRHLVRELLDDGRRVRALSRDPARAGLPAEVEVVGGDLAEPDTLGGVFDGVVAVHLITFDGSGPLTNGRELVELAVKAGVRRATTLWSGEVGDVERAVAAGGLEWTRLEPVEYMSNALAWAESVRAEGLVREPFPEEPSAMVHEGDIARVAAAALVGDGHTGRSYSLTGPEVLTVPDKVRILAAALGRDLRYVELSESAARERMRAAGTPEDVVDFVIGWHRNPPEQAYSLSSTIEEVTGLPPRSFADWAREHASAFSVPPSS
ncbi:NAD(P)H-binding protein [Streptomyces sp. SID3343]|uniref:NmrA family NAD(P)-binding protein n=1 Tax=Streptomyces sp. SID3343 TaxID=2690260 RepID=UPI00136EF0F1|nr:NAD(P)H-binding protein [Streptomyces sp. SID3343]MYV99387.1 NAD(P)H-binding protein [Streptomyces sp. SID3343]